MDIIRQKVRNLNLLRTQVNGGSELGKKIIKQIDQELAEILEDKRVVYVRKDQELEQDNEKKNPYSL